MTGTVEEMTLVGKWLRVGMEQKVQLIDGQIALKNVLTLKHALLLITPSLVMAIAGGNIVIKRVQS